MERPAILHKPYIIFPPTTGLVNCLSSRPWEADGHHRTSYFGKKSRKKQRIGREKYSHTISTQPQSKIPNVESLSQQESQISNMMETIFSAYPLPTGRLSGSQHVESLSAVFPPKVLTETKDAGSHLIHFQAWDAPT